MKKILALLLATSSLAAFADSTNLYVGAGAGAGWNNDSYPAAAFRLDGGYNFNDYVAVELGTTGITQSGTGINQSMQYYDASIKGTLPLGDLFSLVGQVGGAYGSPGSIGNPGNATPGTYPGVNQAGWNFLTGAGVQMNLTKQVSINLTDYYYYGAPNPQGNTNVLLGGVKYNF
jgi:hypothetical protein